MAISDYLNKLVELKNDLITTLRNKGVEVSDDEKLNTLVPKVAEIEGESSVTFDNKGNMTSVIFPNGLTSIDERVIQNLGHVEYVKIPDGVVSIGKYAFSGCNKLKDIVIPISVKSFSNGVLYNCYDLRNICYAGTQEQWDAITKGSSWNEQLGRDVEGGTVIVYNYVPE